jgi:hypothetical protein
MRFSVLYIVQDNLIILMHNILVPIEYYNKVGIGNR